MLNNNHSLTSVGDNQQGEKEVRSCFYDNGIFNQPAWWFCGLVVKAINHLYY